MSGSRPAISSANDLRKAFEGFFASKAHTVVPSASLIPHDPTVLFTVAGMVPFKPYFVGDEAAPFKRAVTVQKCTRAGGKHNDLDEVGRTKRHLVFFEMMGNFSFGDYFKSDAIPWAWELVTEVFGFDGDRLWITVHESDDEAEQIWHEVVGVPMSRIQRLGDEDNFWQMGDAGPCGPCSEIHIDRGPAFGPEGGPLHDPHGDRYMEFWNLVFMQYNQSKDGSRTPLPKPSIDTGAGLERILALMQGTDSVWETDVLFPMIESAQSLTSKKYKIGDYDDRDSFSLRVLAEHARSSMMLVNDGVFPSNENRGYVLRRIIRRAVRHAYLLGTEKLVMPTLAETAISVMSGAYPDLLANKDFIVNVLSREEERFRQTLKTGLTILEGELSAGAKTMSGTTAFTLHDTYGFPIELTQEIAGERSVLVDVAGFSQEMQEQRDRAKSARKGSSVSAATVDSYREVMEQFGTTNFVGYVSNQCEATVLAVLQNVEAGPGIVEVFLDVSPFYAESGGQVGDTGTIRTESGEVQVLDTTFALPGLRRHTCSIVSGDIEVGQSAKASINVVARDATRRNHTATHMLHWALRQVLGEHVKQAGSHVSPDRLRFDFSHYAPVSASEIEEIERLTNEQLIANGPVRAYETSKDEATAAGAIAFFGDKYGDIVRVLEAGVSVELCGGTHVGALGDIGMVKVVTESSIGSNLRRIEAVTGANAVEYVLAHHRTLTAAASLLGAQPSELVSAIQRKIDESKALGEELRSLRSAQATSRASEMAASAQGGVVVSRVDGVTPNDLRELALAIRQNAAIKVVVLGGVTDTGGVALVATVSSDVSVAAGDLIRDAAKAVGGGGGGKGDIATAGGKDPSAIDAALELARSAVAKVLST
ncbi:MAG: alanine--tRNA ligase [Actinobacteria bacterium]|uniref:Alanine--tRNA ligase n=2 Tax=freshwater metagenome TaxID=449393 RepID=A0A6J6K6Y9_9ZZZZ|nr:alanine--tRNA ligase [Actinomycetota bacterium]MSZ34023.1 alanine--tRNA ligase [Actinomycetota bacterium]